MKGAATIISVQTVVLTHHSLLKGTRALERNSQAQSWRTVATLFSWRSKDPKEKQNKTKKAKAMSSIEHRGAGLTGLSLLLLPLLFFPPPAHLHFLIIHLPRSLFFVYSQNYASNLLTAKSGRPFPVLTVTLPVVNFLPFSPDQGWSYTSCFTKAWASSFRYIQRDL